VINENQIDENEVEEDSDSEGEKSLVEETPATSRSLSGLQREISNIKHIIILTLNSKMKLLR
jgi:hypothetical protein